MFMQSTFFFSVTKIYHFQLSPLPWGFPGASVVKNPPANAGDVGLIPGSERSLEEEMATHLRILAARISWTEEPGGLQFLPLQRVRHNLETKQQSP